MNAEEFDACIREKNALVDRGQAPENIATYSPCYPNDKYAKFPDNFSSCMEIYERRMLAGTLPPGVAPTREAVMAHCRAKVAAIHPPETPWDWLGNAVSDVGDVLKTAAPFVQTALSFIPGIGTIASAAIGAGVALASGLPIDAAMVAAVKGALPGGPVAAAAFDVGVGIIQGKRIEDIGISALPIPDVAKGILTTGAAVARQAAEGKPISAGDLTGILVSLPPSARAAVESVAGQGSSAIADKVLSEAGKYLSPDQQKTYAAALGQGLAIGYAQDTQAIQADRVMSEGFIASLREQGQAMAGLDPLAVGTLKVLQPAYANGFLIGLAFTAKPATPTETVALRSALTGPDRRGFDIAISLRNGKKLAASVMTLQAAGAANPAMFQLNKNIQRAITAPKRLTLDGPATQRLGASIARSVALVGTSDAAQATYVATLGMQGATPAQKAGMVSALIQTDAGKRGVSVAVDQVITAKKKGVFQAVLDFLFGRRGS